MRSLSLCPEKNFDQNVLILRVIWGGGGKLQKCISSFSHQKQNPPENIFVSGGGGVKYKIFFVVLASERKSYQKYVCIGGGGKLQKHFVILASETKSTKKFVCIFGRGEGGNKLKKKIHQFGIRNKIL